MIRIVFSHTFKCCFISLCKVKFEVSINKILFYNKMFFYFFLLRGWCMIISSRRRVLSMCV